MPFLLKKCKGAFAEQKHKSTYLFHKNISTLNFMCNYFINAFGKLTVL